MKYEKLFSSIKIKNTVLKNRMIYPAIGTNLADNEGFSTSEMESYYTERAKGGISLIVVENAYVSIEGKVNRRMLSIDKDEVIPCLNKLTDKIKRHGSNVIIQLNHGGRQSTPDVTDLIPVAPSSIACPVLKVEPKALSTEEIEIIIQKYIDASLRALEAGFDGIELQMAHGYLLCQFLSPSSNKRNDLYGGTIEKRCGIVVRIITEIKKKLPGNFLIFGKISADEYIDDGIKIRQSVEIAKILEKSGMDAITVSACNYESAYYNIPIYYLKENTFVHLSEEIKKNIDIPVAAIGRIRSAGDADLILKTDKADLIAFGRPLIADPYFPKKSYDDLPINSCLSCNHCIQSISAGTIECTVNPEAGREDDFIIRNEGLKCRSKKIFIIGGGPAGLTCGIYLAKYGLYDITIFEKNNCYGGQIKLIEKVKGKEYFNGIIGYFVEKASSLKVNFVPNMEADGKFIMDKKPDITVIATGSLPMDSKKFFNTNEMHDLDDVMEKSFLHDKRIVIIGGGPEGCELALTLSSNKNDITLIEKKRVLGIGMNPSIKFHMEKLLVKNNVKIYVNTNVKSVDKKRIICKKSNNEEIIIENFDHIISAIGRQSNVKLQNELADFSQEVYTIGDADKPGTLYDAITQGAYLALKIHEKVSK